MVVEMVFCKANAGIAALQEESNRSRYPRLLWQSDWQIRSPSLLRFLSPLHLPRNNTAFGSMVQQVHHCCSTGLPMPKLMMVGYCLQLRIETVYLRPPLYFVPFSKHLNITIEIAGAGCMHQMLLVQVCIVSSQFFFTISFLFSTVLFLCRVRQSLL